MRVIDKSSVRRRSQRRRICDTCGTEEWVRSDNPATTCGTCSSRKNARSKPRTGPISGYQKQCLSCAKPFYTVPSHDAKFCSVTCRSDYSRVERTCRACSERFTVPRSVVSGKTNASGNFCCRACYEQWLCKPDRVSGRGSRWRQVRGEVLRAQPFCAVCGTRRHLQVHHIVPFRLSYDNSEGNLIPLCVKCHKSVEWVTVQVEMLGVDYPTLHDAISLPLRFRQAGTARYLRKLQARYAATRMAHHPATTLCTQSQAQ